MGDNATYSGHFLFDPPLTADGIRILTQFLHRGVDLRDKKWKQWLADRNIVAPEELYYIPLELDDSLNGLVWNGNEGSWYYAEVDKALNLILAVLRTVQPGAGVKGEMTGDSESGGHWKIMIDAKGVPKVIQGRVIYDEASP